MQSSAIWKLMRASALLCLNVSHPVANNFSEYFVYYCQNAYRDQFLIYYLLPFLWIRMLLVLFHFCEIFNQNLSSVLLPVSFQKSHHYTMVSSCLAFLGICKRFLHLFNQNSGILDWLLQNWVTRFNMCSLFVTLIFVRVTPCFIITIMDILAYL